MEENPFAAPGADTYSRPKEGTELVGVPWFPVGTRKLWTLSLLTFGLYSAYWFERQFRYQKKKRGDSTRPVIRAIFSPFYTNDLFGRVKSAARAKGVDVPWSAGAMTAIYVASAVMGRVFDQASDHATGGSMTTFALLGLATTVGLVFPLAQVQGTINQLLELEWKEADRNEDFSVWNWLVITIGVLCVGMILLGLAHQGSLPE